MINVIIQAATPAAGQGSLSSLLFTFALMGLVIYFLILRPQSQQMKRHREMLASVTRGDTIVTTGGLIGKVTKVTDDELTLDLGNGNKVKIIRSAIAQIQGGKSVAANDTKDSKSKKK